MFSAAELMAFVIVYLTILFGSAYATEKRLIPRSIAVHPSIRVLSLGVFAGAIGLNGTLGLAASYGSDYLLYFIGAGSAFLLAPLLMAPLTRLALTHKLGSLSDVLAFRYPAPWVGGLISGFMLVGVLPLLALQIQAVSQTMHVINQEFGKDIIALAFCTMMIVFAILFGARHLSTRDKHEGLVMAIGIESIVKLLAFAALGYYSLFHVLGGPDGLKDWMASGPEQILLANEIHGAHSRVMLMLFFGAAVAMPHMYHMLITENDDERVLSIAIWGFPLYMMILGITIPFVLWAAWYLGVPTAPEMYGVAIGVATGNPAMTMIALLAGMAAASGVLIVTTLALSSMVLNHVLLPLYRPSPRVNFSRLLINSRRVLICFLVMASYGIYRLLGEEQSLVSLGIVSFVAVLQFVPGLVGAFHWRGGNKTGLLVGLVGGYGVWAATLLIPLVQDIVLGQPSNNAILQQDWPVAATLALLLNAICFVLVSRLSHTSDAERAAADECMSDAIVQSFRAELQARSVSEIESSLAVALGADASNQSVRLALDDLRFGPDETRPHALSQLRSQLETNLASLLGQTIAHRIIETVLPYRASGSVNIHTIETRLEQFRIQLTGLAAELDSLRRHHRQLLQSLPTAVCSLDENQILRIWNTAMAELTGVSSMSIVGSHITHLPEPWKDVLLTFVYDSATNRPNYELRLGDTKLLLNLHKAAIDTLPQSNRDLIIVIEDLTESQLLEEQLLHKERLATIGQFAAGVAHEIGNPVTGIACLAQDLLQEPASDQSPEVARQILEQTERISTILQTLTNFAHGSGTDRAVPMLAVNIKQCINEAVRLLSLSRRDNPIALVNDCEDLYVLGNPQRLAQVFINLMTNAQDAMTDANPGMAPGNMGHRGTIRMTTELCGEDITIRISDQGPGMTQDQLKLIFDPFYTTKDPGKGTGLGLPIVSSILREHNGDIQIGSTGAEGTTVAITLPRYQNG
ncbi:MAG: ATP-binding protein [Proteobacteria bacterium]|nr:ATP-binding protein [Pseudomonadota bacterium]